MSEVKWIKIKTDIFDDEKVLLIESMPDAYAIITVWFKLLCLAGKQNNSGVFLMNEKIAYTDKMLATIFRMKESTVTMALQTFESFGMVELVDGVITIPNWNKHQTLDAYEKKKERDRLYQAERRANQKALIAQSSEKSSDTSVDCSSDVVVSDKEEDKEEEIDNKYILSAAYSEIIDYLNEKADTKYKSTGKKTQSLIKARMNDGFTVEDFKTVIDNQCSKWLNDSKMQDYLRPETLFGTKFEGYLNSKPKGSGNYGTAKKDNSFTDIGTVL